MHADERLQSLHGLGEPVCHREHGVNLCRRQQIGLRGLLPAVGISWLDQHLGLAVVISLARWRGEAGDPAGAVAAFEKVVADRLRVQGPDHPNTLGARISLARWRGEAGDPAGAAAASAEVVAECLRVLGPDHPATIDSRRQLASWTEQASSGPSPQAD